jgi:hypothetical protein
MSEGRKDWSRVHPNYSNSVVWVRYGALDEEDRRMALKLPDDLRIMRMDKRLLKQAVAELNAQMGFEKDPEATPEKAQQMLLDAGVRPEDNIASCEILRMRYEKDEA